MEIVNNKELEGRAIDMLQKHKIPLLQVLRYRDEWRFVPQEIELPIKYIIKRYQEIGVGKTTQDPESNAFIKRLSLTDFEIHSSSIYAIQIQLDEKAHGANRKIHYEGKIYEELFGSGNSYNHINFQDKQIREWLDMDVKWGILSKDEAEKIIIYNYVHDIPEIGDQSDVIASSKTEDHRKKEKEFWNTLIDQQPWDENQKEEIKQLFIDNEWWLFKLYEIMYYMIDIQNMVSHKEKYNNSLSLAVAIIGFHMPRYLKSYKLPNQTEIFPLALPSFRSFMRNNMPAIDVIVEGAEPYLSNERRKGLYQESKHIRDTVIKPNILST